MFQAVRVFRTLVLAILLGALGFLGVSAHAQSSVRPPDNAAVTGELTAPLGEASDADVWRYLKHGGTGAPAPLPDGVTLPRAPGRPDSLVETFLDEIQAPPQGATSQSGNPRVMQVLGEEWRLIRRSYILPYAGWPIAAVLVLLALFYLVRGRIRIASGRSGRTIVRFTLSHRIIHWVVAVTFVLLGLSGLTILLGRPLLLPLIGKEANAILANAALQVHNFIGPVFVVALLAMIVRFMRGNFFHWVDLKWLLKGGGFFGGHASSHYYNFGEKTWYWVVVFVGLLMCATGLLLLFPWLTDVLAWIQLATILHVGGAVLMISFALGHIYIGTIGMEGSLESMTTGKVDENWAKEHHDLWYEDVTGKKAHGHAEEGAA